MSAFAWIIIGLNLASMVVNIIGAKRADKARKLYLHMADECDGWAGEYRQMIDRLDGLRKQRFDEALSWTLDEHGETLRRLGEGDDD